MRRPRLFLNWVTATALVCWLQGCAVYQKCGLHGCPGDAAISADVQTLFDQHPVLMPPNLIHVQVLDRVVYLTGIVDTDLERKIAADVALQAPGVTRVVSSIGLSGGR
jgi:osmotically-inducible protein OsmY